MKRLRLGIFNPARAGSHEEFGAGANLEPRPFDRLTVVLNSGSPRD